MAIDHAYLNTARRYGERSFTKRQLAFYFFLVSFLAVTYLVPPTILTAPLQIGLTYMLTSSINFLFKENKPPRSPKVLAERRPFVLISICAFILLALYAAYYGMIALTPISALLATGILIGNIASTLQISLNYPSTDLFIFTIKSAAGVYALTHVASYMGMLYLTELAIFVTQLIFAVAIPSISIQTLYHIAFQEKNSGTLKILNAFLVASVALTGIHYSLFSYHCLNILCGTQTPAILTTLSNPSIHAFSALSVASAYVMPKTQFGGVVIEKTAEDRPQKAGIPDGPITLDRSRLGGQAQPSSGWFG